ncbi:MAG TPA: dockerin type I repeat-containing protein, partial [candidate division Zixibacteria bacterium]
MSIVALVVSLTNVGHAAEQSSQRHQPSTLSSNEATVCVLTINCPADKTIQCHQSNNPSFTGTATYTSNPDCGTVTLTYSDAETPGGCPAEKTIARTWTATATSGDMASCVQTIFVEDTTPPSYGGTCGTNANYQCVSQVQPLALGGVGPIDQCDPSVSISSSRSDNGGSGCPGDPLIFTDVFSFTDDCGNSSQCVRTHTVIDDTPPVFTVCPADFDAGCFANVPPCDPGDATATDNCSAVTITCNDSPPPGGGCSGTITRTYTATDACGNTETCVQLITVSDDPPTIVCPDDFSVDCLADVPACDPGDATATDDCGGVTVTCSDGPLVGGTCSGTITRTFTATDDCGNQTSCDQIITVTGDVPAISCPADFDVACLEDVPPCNPNDATATANCGSVTITCSDGPLVGGPCSGTITRTYTATYECGGVASCDQIITVLGDIPTITCPDDFNVGCLAELPPCDPNDATVTTNCGSVTVTCSDGPLVGDPCGGTVTRTYVATSECGSMASCDQIITIGGSSSVTISCLSNIIVQRFADLPPCDPNDATVTGGCDVVVTCFRSSVGGVGCTDVSVPITYTYTATDACGNEAFCERVVTVLRPDCPFFVAAGDVSSPVDVAVGGRSTIPIRLDSAQSDVGSFELAFAYDDNVFSIAQVERGSALADWEYFTYRLETGVIRLIAMADLANGAMHPPSSAYRPVGVLANVTVNVTPNRQLAGQSVYWQACLDGCTDNTISSRSGDMTFVMAESDYENCEASLSGSVLPGVRLASAQMRIVEPAGSRGDINQNGLSYEVGDAILLVNYLINGVEVFSEDAALRALQVQAGDVNGDGVSLTVADLTYLIRVISGAVSPTIEAKLSPYAG